jgi:hypothetical protein
MTETRRGHVWVVSMWIENQWRVHGVFEDLADCFAEAHTDDPRRTWTVVVDYGHPAWLHSPAAENSGPWKINRATLFPPDSSYRPPYAADPERDELAENEP